MKIAELKNQFVRNQITTFDSMNPFFVIREPSPALASAPALLGLHRSSFLVLDASNLHESAVLQYILRKDIDDFVFGLWADQIFRTLRDRYQIPLEKENAHRSNLDALQLLVPLDLVVHVFENVLDLLGCTDWFYAQVQAKFADIDIPFDLDDLKRRLMLQDRPHPATIFSWAEQKQVSFWNLDHQYVPGASLSKDWKDLRFVVDETNLDNLAIVARTAKGVPTINARLGGRDVSARQIRLLLQASQHVLAHEFRGAWQEFIFTQHFLDPRLFAPVKQARATSDRDLKKFAKIEFVEEDDLGAEYRLVRKQKRKDKEPRQGTKAIKKLRSN